MPLELLTPRLRARPIQASDYDFVFRMSQDARVMAHIGGIRTEAKARENFANALSQWETRGYGLYLVHDATTGALVGQAGLFYRELDGRLQTDLGYSFLPEAWGKGYATEIGQAVLKFGFGKAGLKSIVAFTAPQNVASRGVLDKLGFRYEKDFAYRDEPSVLYRRDA